MQKINTVISKKNDLKLKQAYMDACSNPKFKEYVDSINLKDDILGKYTSQLEDVLKEHEHCLSCPSLKDCKNSVRGHFLEAIVEESGLNFAYLPCHYQQRQEKITAHLKNMTCYDLPNDIKKASLKEIYKDDKKRLPIIKYFKTFMDAYLNHEKPKGIYLYGSFGSGKTYLIAALFNELAHKDIASALIYYPEFLRGLKASFGSNYEERYQYIKTVPVLLLDDIGAENVTAWSRDEILGPLLQYRMEEHLPTFFTSNLTLEELETNLSITSNGVDKIKAKRIVERIKQLSIPMALISKNRRN